MSRSALHKLSKPAIYVTHNAWKKMENIIKISKNQLGFIFHASSGGCNGFNFKLELLERGRYEKINGKSPMVLQNNSGGVKLYVDPMSEMVLLGTTIDYIKEDYDKGLFENKFLFHVDPKIASSCGCGISFTPKNFK